ncbi:MAG TPA: alpha/beta hydrolase [Lacunisphaera sp.]|jgi:predicted esterase
MKFSYQHVFIPGTDPLASPLLLLHGTGGDENDLIPLGQSLSAGSPLLSPRGDVLENGMPRFFRRFAEGVFDLADVEKRTQALADFIAVAAAHYQIDSSKLVAIGYSNGANIAASLLLLRPEAISGAVLLRPMVVLEPKSLPKLNGKRILISSGQHDPIVPVDHPVRLAHRFREAGADVTVNSHAGGHGLTQADFTAARRFFSEKAG